MMRRLVAAALLLLLVPAGSAQLNGPLPYEADYGFDDPAEDGFINVLSGKLQADVAGSGGPFGFWDAIGWRIDGLDEVCFRQSGQTRDCEQGDMALVVRDGGSAGIQFPVASRGTYTAEHALGMFLSQRGDDLNSLRLNESLLAPAVEGQMVFQDIPDISSLALFGVKAPQGILAPTTSQTSVEVVKDGEVIRVLQGKDVTILFAGAPEIPPFESDLAVLPFKEGSEATFTPAETEAAKEGLDFENLQRLLTNLDQASEEGAPAKASDAPDNPLQDTMAEVLDAALLRVPTGDADDEAFEQEFSIVLFKSLTVANGGQAALVWDGQAPLQYEDGEIVGAQDIYGFWYFQLPWWGWLLWVVAIGLFIARLVIKPERHHERWDQYRWIGWVAGAVVMLFVLFMWDLETRAVWGTSVLSSGLSGTAFWITFAVQLGTMMLVLGAVAWPMNILVKNGLLLAKQGTFMGLGKPIALLFAYLLGATLFLSYLELIVQSIANASA